MPATCLNPEWGDLSIRWPEPDQFGEDWEPEDNEVENLADLACELGEYGNAA